jgi:hypothetical protein
MRRFVSMIVAATSRPAGPASATTIMEAEGLTLAEP